MIKELITVDASCQVDDRLERARFPSIISIKRSARFGAGGKSLDF